MSCCDKNTDHPENLSLKVSASSTVHCLTGCAIGEFLGLAIGSLLGLSVFTTIALAVFLAFVFGFLLSLVPLIFGKKMSLRDAMKSIWLGEVISISVMEFAMNLTDYHIGGIGASVTDPLFWMGYAGALIAGFLAAWPVNHWMISRNIKGKCH